jgi:nitrite reductase (NADH) small subunit
MTTITDVRAAGVATAWTPVCSLDDLVVERGAAALLPGPGGPVQVALFRLVDGRVLAVQQLDPFAGANVMSRGLVGTRGSEPTVAGPLYKQVYSLVTGECLETAGYAPRPGLAPRLATFPVRVSDGVVSVGLPEGGGAGGEGAR